MLTFLKCGQATVSRWNILGDDREPVYLATDKVEFYLEVSVLSTTKLICKVKIVSGVSRTCFCESCCFISQHLLPGLLPKVRDRMEYSRRGQNKTRPEAVSQDCFQPLPGGDGGESNSPSKQTHRRIYYRFSRCFSVRFGLPSTGFVSAGPLVLDDE